MTDSTPAFDVKSTDIPRLAIANNRREALQLANSGGGHPDEVVARAKAYLAFLRGDD